eukprot:2944016-Prymnesium_polylepis.2
MDEVLDPLTLPSCLIDPIYQHDQRTHLICLHEHLAHIRAVRVDALDVELEQLVYLALSDQLDDALHIHDHGRQRNASSSPLQIPGQVKDRLLDHPGFTCTWSCAHKHGLRGMRTMHAVRRWNQQLLHEAPHILHLPLVGHAVALQLARRGHE